MYTDLGSEEVFEAAGFSVSSPWKKTAFIEFSGRKTHADCSFVEDDFKILHAQNISRAKILRIATTKPQCLDCLD